MSERGILELAKALGQVEIVPGLKLFTRDYFKKGKIVALDIVNLAEVISDDIFQFPFVFVLAGEMPNGKPKIFECKNEDKALLMIESIIVANNEMSYTLFNPPGLNTNNPLHGGFNI